jgi:hypothetical protein
MSLSLRVFARAKTSSLKNRLLSIQNSGVIKRYHVEQVGIYVIWLLNGTRRDKIDNTSLLVEYDNVHFRLS